MTQRTEIELMFTEEIKDMPAPWPVDVDVYLESVGPPVQFRVESYLQTVAKGDLVFHNRGRPGFTISFHLHDDTNGQYVFPPDANDAIWSQLGSSCPTTPIYTVFQPVSVDPTGQTLVVQNDNPGPPGQGRFQYTLRVTNDGGTSYVAIDPGGTNGNGSSAK